MSEEAPRVESDQEKINYLERLQTEGQIGEEKWNRDVHWPLLSELREKGKNGSEPTQEQINRFNELSKLQTAGGESWTAELAEEIKALYPLIDRRNK
jgi:hypothetical protein